MKSLGNLSYIIWVCIILFAAAGFYRGHTLGNMYGNEADAVKKPDTHFALWSSSEQTGNTKLKSKVFLLSGSTDLGGMKVDSALTIDSAVKTGKGKVLFFNEQNQLKTAEKLDGGKAETVRLPEGNYRILLVGKWMIGSISVKSV